MVIGNRQAKNNTGIMKKNEMSMSSDRGNTNVQMLLPSFVVCSLNHNKTGTNRMVPNSHVIAENKDASFGDIFDRYGGTTMHLCLSMLIKARVHRSTIPETNCKNK